MNVSVPSRGILFPNEENKYEKIKWCSVSVPSRGILFPNWKGKNDVCGSCWFPSPLGVSYFQIVTICIKLLKDMVSVPSRGILFPNKNLILRKKELIMVSVPSRGILFPNQGFKNGIYQFDMFPSPLGVSYFQIHVSEHTWREV